MRLTSPWAPAAKMFVFGGLFFGLGSGLLSSLSGETRFVAAASAGLTYGLLMATTLGALHHIVGRRFAGGKTPAVVQSETVSLSIDQKAAVDALMAGIRQLNPRRLEVTGDAHVRIVAATRMSWKSWGERIEAVVSREGNTGASVQLESRPILKSTLVDYGKAADNINHLTASLSQETSSSRERAAPLPG